MFQKPLEVLGVLRFLKCLKGLDKFLEIWISVWKVFERNYNGFCIQIIENLTFAMVSMIWVQEPFEFLSKTNPDSQKRIQTKKTQKPQKPQKQQKP